jgi:hypothetical protein
LKSSDCWEEGRGGLKVTAPETFRDIQGTFTDQHSGNTQGTFREHSGSIQGTFREQQTGKIQAPTFRDHSGSNVQGTFRDRRSGNIQGPTFRAHSGNIQETIRKHSGNIH